MKIFSLFLSPVTPPAQRVQFILGEDADAEGNHESHPLFSEMEELVQQGDEMEWKETARYANRLSFHVNCKKTCA